MADGVNSFEWLDAVLRHDGADDVCRLVATSIALHGTPATEDLNDSDIEWALIDLDELGFLEYVTAVELDGGTDHMWSLRIPDDVAA